MRHENNFGQVRLSDGEGLRPNTSPAHVGDAGAGSGSVFREPFFIIPALTLAVAATGVVETNFPAVWGPVEPSYQIVVDFRGTVAVLEDGLSEFDCRRALPYSDQLKQVTFTCEREA